MCRVVGKHFEPCVASVGLPFAFAELNDLRALETFAPDIAAFRTAAAVGPKTVDGFAICAFVVLKKADHKATIRSRVLSPLGHPPEDPATGSASAALSNLLAQSTSFEQHVFEIIQGVEMGRESTISVEIEKDAGKTRIKGHCVTTSEGTIYI